MNCMAVLRDEEGFTKWVVVEYPPPPTYDIAIHLGVPSFGRSDSLLEPIATHRKTFYLDRLDQDLRLAFYKEQR